MGRRSPPLFCHMSAIRDGRYPIMLDRQRHMLFSLNAIDALEDKFGGFDKLGEVMEGKGAIKNLRWIVTLLLNEGADSGAPELTETEVGRLIHAGNIDEVKAAMFKTFAIGNTGKPDIGIEAEEPEDDEEDGDEGNAEAGKG